MANAVIAHFSLENIMFLKVQCVHSYCSGCLLTEIDEGPRL